MAFLLYTNYVRNTSRLYPYLLDLFTFDAVLLAAVMVTRGYDPSPDIGSIVKACAACNCEIRAEIDGFLRMMDEDSFPDTLAIQVLSKLPPPKGRPVMGLQSLSERTCGAIFALYVDAAIDWIKANHSTAYDQWPPVANFGRVVRNAIVHGGRINIQSETAPAVKWREVEISHRNAGQQLFSSDRFSSADLVMLMFALDKELDGIGAPLDLR